MYFISSILLLIQIIFVVSNEDEKIQREKICDKSKYSIITDFTQEDCPENHYYFKETENSCIPHCEKISFDFTTPCDPLLCPPGYKCMKDDVDDDGYCTLDEESCFKYHIKYKDVQNVYYEALWKPKCTEDGKWAAKQCKGESANGRCFCYDEFGNRLFGEEWSTKAENMTCACSRRRAELEKDASNWFVSLHCDSQGNYEELQCDLGQCWCVEPKTGKVLSKTVPESMMIYLPCYSEKKVGDKYFRQCDSNLYAQAKARKELFTHGTVHVNFPSLMCDGDGSYGKYHIKNGIAYCTWKDNSYIGSWQTSMSNNLKNMNCYCARDSKIYTMEGLAWRLDCQENGNYKPLQQEGTNYYCVDNDGFQKSPLSNDKNIKCENFK